MNERRRPLAKACCEELNLSPYEFVIMSRRALRVAAANDIASTAANGSLVVVGAHHFGSDANDDAFFVQLTTQYLLTFEYKLRSPPTRAGRYW